MTKKKDKLENELLEKLVADGKNTPETPQKHTNSCRTEPVSEGEIEKRLAAAKALQGIWKDLPKELVIAKYRSPNSSLCPWEPRACEWVSTYVCTKECEFHPESYNIDKDILEKFETEPWSVYCLTCGEFLDSRYGHPPDHIIATGIMEYREKIPQFVMERMTNHAEETGDMSW